MDFGEADQILLEQGYNISLSYGDGGLVIGIGLSMDFDVQQSWYQ